MFLWEKGKVEVLSCLGKGEVRELEWLRGREVRREGRGLGHFGEQKRKKNKREKRSSWEKNLRKGRERVD